MHLSDMSQITTLPKMKGYYPMIYTDDINLFHKWKEDYPDYIIKYKKY